MTRLFSCPAIGSLLAVAIAAATATGCAPDNDVKPGAPVLTKFVLVQQGYARTTIDSSAVSCATGVTTGAACVGGDDPATEEAELPDPMCQQTSHDWCQCDASGDSPVWGCGPFTGVRAVVAIFDRLLDPTTLSNGPAALPDTGAEDSVLVSVSAGAPDTTLLTDYASNGSISGLVVPYLAYVYYMNYRFDGPSLFAIPTPTGAFPSGATVTLTVNKGKVHAKDGVTPFEGEGLLVDGSLSFNTPAFGVAELGPTMIAPDMGPVSITFTNVVDADAVAGHITVTSSSGAVAVTTAKVDDFTVAVTPVTPWPASATLTFTVDAATPNLLGQTFGAPVTATVTVSAS